MPKTFSDLRWIHQGILQSQVPVAVIGRGSNLLVADRGFPGVVVSTKKLELEIRELSQEPLIIEAGSGVAIFSLLSKAAQKGWGGFEFLAGVPGSVGGAVYMNAGTRLGETAGALLSVKYCELNKSTPELVEKTINADQLQFQYRKNLFLKEGDVVLSAVWKAVKSDPAQIKTAIDGLLKTRKNSQPVDLPCCGSVFKNPKDKGLHAWQVVEQLGLRGHRVGGAEISQKHTNFIVNVNHAKAADVQELIALIKARAHKELGIELEEEVKYLGF